MKTGHIFCHISCIIFNSWKWWKSKVDNFCLFVATAGNTGGGGPALLQTEGGSWKRNKINQNQSSNLNNSLSCSFIINCHLWPTINTFYVLILYGPGRKLYWTAPVPEPKVGGRTAVIIAWQTGPAVIAQQVVVKYQVMFVITPASHSCLGSQ